MLAALESVSLVTLFDEATPLELLKLVRPELYVKGGDYDIETLAETALVRSWGGAARALPFVERLLDHRAGRAHPPLIAAWQRRRRSVAGAEVGRLGTDAEPLALAPRRKDDLALDPVARRIASGDRSLRRCASSASSLRCGSGGRPKRRAPLG